jgi:hypothetical protein
MSSKFMASKFEKFCHFRQFQRVWYFAVNAAESTSTCFDKHKVHWLVALRTWWRRGILGHWLLAWIMREHNTLSHR